MSSLTSTVRVEPLTSTVHLDFNAGEDVEVDLDVVSGPTGIPVSLASAVATIADAAGTVLHTWTTDGATPNALIVETLDPDYPNVPSIVRLKASRAETAAWFEAWGDAEWQLEVVDIYGQQKRPAEGEVRVRARLREDEQP